MYGYPAMEDIMPREPALSFFFSQKPQSETASRNKPVQMNELHDNVAVKKATH